MIMRVLSATLAVDGCTPISSRNDVAEDMIEGVVWFGSRISDSRSSTTLLRPLHIAGLADVGADMPPHVVRHGGVQRRGLSLADFSPADLGLVPIYSICPCGHRGKYASSSKKKNIWIREMFESKAIPTHIVLAEKRTSSFPSFPQDFGLSGDELCPSADNLSFSLLLDTVLIVQEGIQQETVCRPRKSEEA